MPEYAAFLRGMNIGAHHRITSDDLRSRFAALGFEAVETFRASGNVLFVTGEEPLAAIATRVKEGLEASLGYAVAAFVRTPTQVRAIAASRPFARALVEGSAGKAQVALLSGKPPARVRKEVLSLATDEDRLSFGEGELFWLPGGGISESSLDLKRVEVLLGAFTIRTKGTVEQLASRYFQD